MDDQQVDLEHVTKDELLDLAESRGIDVKASMTKAEIISLLTAPVVLIVTSPDISIGTEAAMDVPQEAVDEEQFGPWEIAGHKFMSFVSGAQEGLSVVALIQDADHATEYSVSFVRGLDQDDNVVAVDETDEQLQERLLATVVREANDPSRASLIKSRFRN